MGDQITCPCNHCSGFLEFDSDHIGTLIECPHCHLDTTLFQPPTRPATPPIVEAPTPPPPQPNPDTLIRNPELRLCATCGSVGRPHTRVPGSFVIELFLWLIFLLPGLIYSIWRVSTKHQVCGRCQSRELVPLDSARAAAMARQLGVDIGHWIPYRPTSHAWQWVKVALIIAGLLAFALVYNQARENEQIIRDAEAAARFLR